MTRAVLGVYRRRGPVYGVAIALLIAVSLSTRLPLGEGASRARGVLAVGGVCVLAVSVLLVLIGPRLLPVRQPVTVAAPVRGRWLGMNSPASKVPSHGVRMYGQAYAIDLVYEPADARRPGFGEGAAMLPAERYPAFDEPVFAMVDGTVVRASDRRRDHRARSNWISVIYLLVVEGTVRELGGPGFILGNHVTIRTADREYATVAHLRQRSVTVRVGQTVRAGQQIGRCGNSGNSSEPHVHAQLMDRVSPWTAQGIPIAFRDITLDDDAASVDALPGNGQHLTAPDPDAARL